MEQVQANPAGGLAEKAAGRARRRPSFWKKLALAGAALLVAALLCELLARLVFPAPPNPYRDPPIVYLADRELAFVHQPSQQGWIDDGLVTINSLGLRGPEVVEPKPKDTFRVLVLGDSIALGWGVNDDETFCSRLEERLRRLGAGRRIEVVNCGVSGYDTKNEVAQFARLAPRLQPDLVLLAFYLNDIAPRLHEAAGGAASDGVTRIEPAHVEEGQVLNMRQKPSWVKRAVRQSRAFYCLGRVVQLLNKSAQKQEGGQFVAETLTLKGEDTPAVIHAWKKTEEDLATVVTQCRQRGCAAGLIIMPCREQVAKDYPNARYQSVVRDMGERLGFFVIDPLPQYLERRSAVDALFIPYDRHHPSVAGHRLLGEIIFEYLDSHQDLLKGSATD